MMSPEKIAAQCTAALSPGIAGLIQKRIVAALESQNAENAAKLRDALDQAKELAEALEFYDCPDPEPCRATKGRKCPRCTALARYDAAQAKPQQEPK